MIIKVMMTDAEEPLNTSECQDRAAPAVCAHTWGPCGLGAAAPVRATLAAGPHAELASWLKDAHVYLLDDFDISMSVKAHHALERCGVILHGVCAVSALHDDRSGCSFLLMQDALVPSAGR
jgi:hypothetical protein